MHSSYSNLRFRSSEQVSASIEDLLIQDGIADASTIDEAVKASLAIRFPVMGILEKNDQAGLDLVLNNFKAECFNLVNTEEPPAILETMVKAGRLGFKSGHGFYDYSDLDKEKLARERDEKLLKIRKLMQEIGEL
jgi:3-hydroxybutyryl-CoA dehydrogenase